MEQKKSKSDYRVVVRKEFLSHLEADVWKQKTRAYILYICNRLFIINNKENYEKQLLCFYSYFL